MELLQTEMQVGESGVQRLVGTIRFRDGCEELIWFETPSNLHMNQSGTPWLAALLPLAATMGEPIRLSLPVDSEFLFKAKALLRLWKSWYTWIHDVPLEVEMEEGNGRKERKKESSTCSAASFFSGGVDSFFTALRHPEITNWITWLGFDMPVWNREAFNRHHERLSGVASEMGKVLIAGATNLRQTRWKKAPWELLSFGPALGAVALFLEPHFTKILVPSCYDYANLFPWGSHPLVIQLFSSRDLEVLQDGTEFTRLEKTDFICRHDIALRNLHVCYRGRDGVGQDETNCCRCGKCYRTMLTLDLCGKLKEAQQFRHEEFKIERVAQLFIGKDEEPFMLELHALAKKNGRNDVANAIEKSILRSRSARKWLSNAEKLEKTRFLWRLSKPLKDIAMDGFIQH